jgi:hypothetical protein
MTEALLLVAGFVAGCLAGGGLVWYLLKQPRPAAARLPAPPPEPAESEVSQLASASRNLMNELETRYEGRRADEGEGPKRRRRRS